MPLGCADSSLFESTAFTEGGWGSVEKMSLKLFFCGPLEAGTLHDSTQSLVLLTHR